MLGTSEAGNENHSDEVRLVDGDFDNHQGKLTSRRPKVKAVKLSAAVAEMVAGIPSTIVARAGTKDKEKREVQAATLLQRRKTLVARKMTSAAVGTSNLGKNSSFPVRHSSSQPSEEREVHDGRRTNVLDQGMSVFALGFWQYEGMLQLTILWPHL